MTRQSGPRLPSRVLLPDQPLLPAWHLRMTLQASKQVLSLWRSRQNFPPCHMEGAQSYTSTAAVVDWLRERGVDVQVVTVR
jgi:hypothetical protein